MRITANLILLLSFFCSSFYPQTPDREERGTSLPSSTGMSMPSLGGLPSLSAANLTVSVNEEEYIVDAGDVFLIKIDVPGPAVRVLPTTVTSDGFLMLHDAPSLKVRGTLLAEVKEKILARLKPKHPDAEIEVFLYQVHPINVTVIGAVQNSSKQQLLSTSRVFDAVQHALQSDEFDQATLKESRTVEDEYRLREEENYSLRRVEILREGKRYEYDLLRFKLLGDLKQNPYLLDNDIVSVPFKGENSHSILIDGAVGQEIEFEYLSSDKLSDALYFAGGLLPVADSSKIELYRFAEDRKSLKKFIVSVPADQDMALNPDDRIYVRYKPEYHEKHRVEVQGEIKYPGFYAIEEGKTKLSEIIQIAGGFTDKASLENAKIIRQKILLEDKELERLGRMTVEEMTNLEKSYFRLRNREDIRLVACDLEKLVIASDSSQDVLLRDDDLIVIPQKNKVVFVSGGVISPGNIVYDENWTYKQYIATAGDFNKRAKRGNVKIIRSKTGVWLDATENMKLEEGDIVFVPEKEERDWWEIFKEFLTVTSQIAAILFIIANVGN